MGSISQFIYERKIMDIFFVIELSGFVLMGKLLGDGKITTACIVGVFSLIVAIILGDAIKISGREEANG